MKRIKATAGLGALTCAVIVITVTAASGFSDPSVSRAMRELSGIITPSSGPTPTALAPSTGPLTAPEGRDGTGTLADGTYHVAQVVDGDTVKVDHDGTLYTLRLIGLDTPETVDPRRAVQCYGREASDRAKQLLSNQMIRLEADVTQGDADKYGRLLRYVYLPDGQGYNRLMIAEGYAHEYTYRVPYRYQGDFKATEWQARQQERGLWSPLTCAGDTTRPASDPAS